MRAGVPPPCCTTCASSCAIRCAPARVYGAYCPAPNTICEPNVYACALTPRAALAASPSVCTRTPEKSCPKRGSNCARAAAGSGMPPRDATAAAVSTSRAGISPRIVRRVRTVFSSSSQAAQRRAIAGGDAPIAPVPAVRITRSAAASASRSYASSAAPSVALRCTRGTASGRAGANDGDATGRARRNISRASAAACGRRPCREYWRRPAVASDVPPVAGMASAA